VTSIARPRVRTNRRAVITVRLTERQRRELATPTAAATDLLNSYALPWQLITWASRYMNPPKLQSALSQLGGHPVKNHPHAVSWFFGCELICRLGVRRCKMVRREISHIEASRAHEFEE